MDKEGYNKIDKPIFNLSLVLFSYLLAGWQLSLVLYLFFAIGYAIYGLREPSEYEDKALIFYGLSLFTIIFFALLLYNTIL